LGMKWFVGAIAAVLLGFIGALGFVYSGVFNVAADEPHSAWFLWLAETARERSIAVRASGVEVPPNLDDPDLIMGGGADYNEMGTECHLKPGRGDTELRQAMYPQPPDLTKTKRDAAQTFWIIKHGIKMSGMPAWGATHDDQRIWAMVAFLEQLPRLTEDQYQILTARDEGSMSMEHTHGQRGQSEAALHDD